MLGWLARLFRRTQGDAARPAAPAPADGAPAARPAPSGPGAPASPPAAAAPSGPPFAPFAKALGVEVPPPPPDPELDAPAEEDLVLAERLLAHFRKNRPGPASAPSLSLRVLNLVATRDVDVAEMVRLVSGDPALSAGVLTVANSTYYRGLQEIETVKAAVVRLGVHEVARVAGALAARSLFNPRLRAELAAFGPRFAGLYARALTVANGAAFVALDRRGGRPDRAFLGGMLHDVGASIGLRSAAALELSEAAVSAARLDRVLDRVHVEVGAECHQEWQLPQYLTVIAVRHHDREIPGDAEFGDLHAVRLCAALLDLRAPATAPRAAAELVQSAGALGMGPYAVRQVDAEMKEAAQRVASAFGVEPAKAPGARA
jgi:HD-like signal output (HDOD) protein